MEVSEADFTRAGAAASLSATQIDSLWADLKRNAETRGAEAPAARFEVSHLLYYLGALIVLGAMGWFMNTAWERFGGAGIFIISLGYAVLFCLSGHRLWKQPETRTPGGLLYSMAVGMTPLAVYGLERWLGWWPQDDPGNYARFHPWINGSWVVIELATVLTGLVALRRIAFPFLTAPIALALWYFSMDLAALILRDNNLAWEPRCWISIDVGTLMLLAAFTIDVRRRWQPPDFGFWVSLFGLMAFWGGLTSLESHSEAGRAVYCAINLVLLLIGVLVERRAFAVFGAIGVNVYLYHLASDVFQNSLLFPFVLSAIGLAVIAVGIFWQRHRMVVRQAVLAKTPAGLRRLLPQ